MAATRLLRDFAPDDVARITELTDVVERASGVSPLDDDAWTGLHDARGRDVGIALEHDGRLDGYAHLAHHHPHEWAVSLAVRPGTPDERAVLLAEAVAEIARAGAAHVTTWFHDASAADDEVATRAGFRPERELRQLRVALPLPEPVRWPDGVTVRGFRPGADEAAWVEVNNRAFAGHPEQGSWTVDMLRAREGEDWFDPEGFLLAFDAAGLAGFCWTKVHAPRPPHEPVSLGEIYVIGADPARHGTGLGRALTAGGLASLAARGITHGMLYVDGANDAAVGLYTKLGFTTHRIDRAYGLDVKDIVSIVTDTATSTSRYEPTHPELEALLATWGEPRYRARQLWDALYDARLPLADATTLPRVLRDRLAVALPEALVPVTERTASDAMTTKWLWECRDGAQVETVLMRYPSRATVCVSSQAGCAMGCTFCATGQEGFERHLTTGEIVEQVLRAAHASPQRVGNVVFMGMGEPLANYEPVWSAIERLHHDVGISARRITVSTVGVVPGIRRLAREDLPVTLAVSLHAPTDAEREPLVPLNRRYPIAEVLDAAAEFAGAKGRRVTFEYACIAGVNDTPTQGEALGQLLAAFPGAGGAHVNLIPLNRTADFGGAAPASLPLQAFAARVRRPGVTATVRRNRGTDIDAACGQLRSRVAMPRVASGSDTMAT